MLKNNLYRLTERVLVNYKSTYSEFRIAYRVRYNIHIYYDTIIIVPINKTISMRLQ